MSFTIIHYIIIFIPILYLLFLTLSKTKIEWYIFPVFPYFLFPAIFLLYKLPKKLGITTSIILILFWFFNKMP